MSAKSLFADNGIGTLFLERRQFYIEPQRVAELYTDIAPFTTLVGQLNVKYVDDPLFKMFEHRPTFLKQECAVNGTTGTIPNNDIGLADVVVDGIVNLSSVPDASWEGLEMEVWNEARTIKKGVVFVNEVAGGKLTLKLLWAKGASTFEIDDNDALIVIGNVRGEGSFAGEAWADELQIVHNSTQFFSVPVEVTGKLYKAALRGYSNELARLRDEKARQFKMQREKAFILGASVIGTGMDGISLSDGHRTNKDGQKNRTTMGLVPILEKHGSPDISNDMQNLFSISEASYKYSDFVDMSERIFQFDGDRGEKFAFCAPGAISYWSKMDGTNYLAGKSGWQVKLSETQRNALGFNVRMLETPHGILHLVPTKALRYQYNKTMLIIDHNNLFHAIYEKPEFKNNIKTDNDYNGVKDVYNSDEGLGATLQEAHQLINITA